MTLCHASVMCTRSLDGGRREECEGLDEPPVVQQCTRHGACTLQYVVYSNLAFTMAFMVRLDAFCGCLKHGLYHARSLLFQAPTDCHA